MTWRKVSREELIREMRKHNDDLGITCKGFDKNPMKGRVTFKQCQDVPEELPDQRTYEFTSDNKAFIKGQMSNSIFIANIVDGEVYKCYTDFFGLETEGFLLEEQ